MYASGDIEQGDTGFTSGQLSSPCAGSHCQLSFTGSYYWFCQF